jgi:hypothetical protein
MGCNGYFAAISFFDTGYMIISTVFRSYGAEVHLLPTRCPFRDAISLSEVMKLLERRFGGTVN